MTISSVTQRDACFYQSMGPFLANRSVHRAIGYPIYDDPDKEWFIAADRGKVKGFCYRRQDRSGWHIGSCYVVEEARRQGLFSRLLDAATGGLTGPVHLTTCSEIMRGVLERRGFAAGKTRGKFTEYSKEFRA